VSETTVQLTFSILDKTSKSFPKFKEPGRNMLNKFNYPCEEQEPTLYLRECITALANYLVDEEPGRNTLGLKILKTENVQDKMVAISLGRLEHFKRMWCGTC
jgi:hypothetical protein